MPFELIAGIDWFEFEDIMTNPNSQKFFRTKDVIELDLTCLVPPVANMKFPYPKIINSYNRLYNNQNFRQQVKAIKSPVPKFQFDPNKSSIKKGYYVFVLVDCPYTPTITPAKTPTPPPITTPTTKTATTDEAGEYLKQITAKEQFAANISKAFADGNMGFGSFSSMYDNIQEEIAELKKLRKKALK